MKYNLFKENQFAQLFVFAQGYYLIVYEKPGKTTVKEEEYFSAPDEALYFFHLYGDC